MHNDSTGSGEPLAENRRQGGVPDWVAKLRAIGGVDRPWVTVPDAQEFLPMDRVRAYEACRRYVKRIEAERKRRRSPLLPLDVLHARSGELPCYRTEGGARIYLRKDLLIPALLGYDPW